MRVAGVVIQRSQPLLFPLDAQLLRLAVGLHAPCVLRSGHGCAGVGSRGVKVHVRHALEAFGDGV